MKFTPLILLAGIPALAAESSRTYTITYYAETDCTGPTQGYENIVFDQTCHKPNIPSHGIRSAKVAEHSKDRSRYWSSRPRERKQVRFYDSVDCSNTCRDRHTVGDRDWNDCVTFPESPAVQSIGLAALTSGGLGEGIIADGYCHFEHGDSLRYNGQEWRLQQVAAMYFHEVRASEWDDAVHVQNTTHRHAQHGDVDANGRHKMWQRLDEYLEPVALEAWNATKHVKPTKFRRVMERFNDAKEEMCSTLANLLLEATDNVSKQDEVNLMNKEMPDWMDHCKSKTMHEWQAQWNKNDLAERIESWEIEAAMDVVEIEASMDAVELK